MICAKYKFTFYLLTYLLKNRCDRSVFALWVLANKLKIVTLQTIINKSLVTCKSHKAIFHAPIRRISHVKLRKICDF